MQLGIVCNGFHHGGGMEFCLLEVVRTLHEFGEPKPLVFSRTIDMDLPEAALIEPVKIRCPLLPSRMAGFYVPRRAGALARRKGVDVFLGFCRAPNVDIVCCGGTHPGFLKTRDSVSPFDKAVLRIEAEQYHNARRVVAHSRLMAREVEEYFSYPKERITVSYPPLDFAYYKRVPEARKSALREKFGLSDDRINFLFVSLSHKRKGFDLLEKFFESTDLPVRLIVAGRELPRGGYKNIVGIGYQDDISEAYSVCDYSILASLYEPYGRVPVESLCCGTPIVIADNLGCSEVIKPRFKIEFKAGDIASLEAAMRTAVAERSERTAAAASSTDFFTEDFSREAHTRALLKVCREVYEEKKRGGS